MIRKVARQSLLLVRNDITALHASVAGQEAVGRSYEAP
jgi:uncharacterized protein (DUF2236 family)